MHPCPACKLAGATPASLPPMLTPPNSPRPSPASLTPPSPLSLPAAILAVRQQQPYISEKEVFEALEKIQRDKVRFCCYYSTGQG